MVAWLNISRKDKPMSEIALYYAFSQDKARLPIERHILIQLAWLADDNNKCCVSYDDLAMACLCTRNTIILAVKRMVGYGLIHKKRRRARNGMINDTNMYTILVPEAWAKVYHDHCIDKG